MTDRITVLNVDDQPEGAAITAEFLVREDERFTVESVDSGQKALQYLEDHQVDCVVSDYDMPGQNGIELLAAVRQQDEDLPFILFTGKGSEEIASDAISAGVTDYLQKNGGSDSYAILANRVLNAVERVNAQRERRRSERRFEAVIEDPKMLVGILETDGSLLHANRTAMDFLDTTLEEIQGDSFWQTPWFSWSAELQSEVKGWVERAANGEYVEFEADHPHADGHYHQVSGTLRPVTDHEGTVVSLIASARDITDRKQRERELRETTQRFEAIIEASPNAIVVSDADGIVEQWNPAAERIFGWRKTEVLEDRLPIIPPDKEAEFEAHRERLRDGEIITTFETRRQTKAGTVIDVSCAAAPIRNADGAITGAIALFEDISDRKERERTLERTTDRMELALQGSESWLWHWDLKTDVVTQTAVTGVLNVEGDEVSRQVEDFHEEIHPDDRESFMAGRDRAVQGGDVYRNEFRLQREGEIRWIESRGQVYKDDAGQPERVIGIATDITDRKERDRELERMRTLLNRSEDAFYVSDPETAQLRYVSETACRVLGYDREELLEMTLLDIQVALADLEDWYDHIEAMRTEGSVFFEGTHRRKDGSTFPVEVHGSLESIGETEYSVGVARDITHRKAYEAELERQIERLDEFTSVVSHDLRNPLNVASGRLELAQEDCDSEHLDAVSRVHDRMRLLIDDLLTLAREGETATDIEQVHLSDAVQRCWHHVETAEATLATETDRTIRADRSRLHQLLENLLRNAVKHGGDQVTVTVGNIEDGFYIEDDGPGIPKEEREQVFESGYSTTKDGTGFGLSIVKAIIDAHGWAIDVTEGEDGGTRFQIRGGELAPVA